MDDDLAFIVQALPGQFPGIVGNSCRQCIIGPNVETQLHTCRYFVDVLTTWSAGMNKLLLQFMLENKEVTGNVDFCFWHGW